MPKPTKQTREEAEWFFAIGEPTRLTLLRMLVDGPRTVEQLVEACGAHHATVVHHLGILKRAGLVTSTRDGRHQRYALVGATVKPSALELTHPDGRTAVFPLG
jgi:DNA-binding transcriptional ArsR family regulator